MIAAFSTMPLLGHEAGIEQDAEVLRDGRPAHLEMSRKRVDGAGGLDEEVEHPAPRRAGLPWSRFSCKMPAVKHQWRIERTMFLPTPSRVINCTKSGKLVAIGRASSIRTGSRAARPSTRKAIAMR